MSKRIYIAFLSSVGLWCLIIVAAPLLEVFGGATGRSIGDALYLGLSRVCHQIDGRSLHIFGAKFGVCVRCTSIYFSFLAGLIVYPFVRPLDSTVPAGRGWLLLAVVPMAVDAVLNDLRVHQSGDVTRIVTGTLAGVVFAFYILPLVLEAFNQLSSHRRHQGDSHYAGQT